MNKVVALLLILSVSAQAQELLHCGADELRIQTLKNNPEIANAVIERDRELEAFTSAFETTARGGQVYTIPVVFHVIHKFGDENISKEQILDGLDVLNATFRKQIPDTADIHPDFKPIHADCEIEFKLATKDPNGNCHSGINRIASSLTNSGDHRVKNLIHWNPSMYLNVYIVSNAAGLAGHAVWPADADTIPQWDGIVMSHNYMGRIGTSDQTRSVVFAHELGHYLNLHHIWGGNNVPEFYYLPVGQQANCNEDDQVTDTPNTIGWSNCNLNASSCGNPRDNVQNAMDYSYCNVMFTEGQKTRMRACLNSSIANRNNLWSPSNLVATGVTSNPELCAADFTSDKRVVCIDFENQIVFSHATYHSEVDSLSWSFENGAPSVSTSFSPAITYTQPGEHDVSLTVFSNGQSAQITRAGFVIVHQDSTLNFPFGDGFEEANLLSEQRWTKMSLDEDNTWEVTDIGHHGGNRSVFVDSWGLDRLTVDALVASPLDLSNANQMRLAFKYAFASSKDVSSATKLQLQVRKNCESNWSTRLNIIGTNLLTGPQQQTPFTPEDHSLWVQEDINLPSTYFTENFQFRFLFTSEGNNRLFIDDVNVDVNAGIDDEKTDLFSIYPNPTAETLMVEFPSLIPENLEIEIFTTHGKLISFRQFVNAKKVRLDVSELKSGLYFVRVSGSRFSKTQRFIVN